MLATGGWHWLASRRGFPDVNSVVSRVAAAVASPIIAAWVSDSDYGAISGATPDGTLAFEFPINEDDEAEPELARVWTTPELLASSAADLAAWSSAFAPKPVTAEAVLAGMPGQGSDVEPDEEIFFGDPLWTVTERGTHAWAFAEDGLRFILHQLGFPTIQEIGRPDWSDSR